jgi:cell wall-associated NlpC family hydrolase
VNNDNGKDSDYYDLCLQFVTDAYKSANVTLQNFIVPATNSSTYPQDIWRQFKGLQQYVYGGPGITPKPVTAQSGIYGSPEITPPPGALVFFNQTGAHDGHNQASGYYSHIELSLGGGNMISTADQTTVDPGWNIVHDETLAEHAASGAWNTYVGWWLPA